MIRFTSLILFSSFLFLAPTKVFAQNAPYIRIEVGDDEAPISTSSKDENKALKKRIRNLEKAVNELQEELWSLKQGSKSTVIIQKDKISNFVCTVTDPFSKTAIAKATTETEARAKIKEECDSKGIASFNCKDKNITCEKES